MRKERTPYDEYPHKGGGELALALSVVVLVALSAYAFYDLNGHSLDPFDREARLVVTGSMDGGQTDYEISTVPKGSLVMIRHVDPYDFDFEVGQVIAYGSGSMVVTHRVIAVDPDRHELRLKAMPTRPSRSFPMMTS